MKSLKKYIVVSMVIGLSFSFSKVDKEGISQTYRVLEQEPSPVELKLNKDFTFQYTDYAIKEHNAIIRGTYLIKGRNVMLQAENSTIRFHDRWKISEDGNIAKSRKGLSFYRLAAKCI